MNNSPQHFPFESDAPTRVLTLIDTPEHFQASYLARLLEITPEAAQEALDDLPHKIMVDPQRAEYVEAYLKKSHCFYYFDVPTETRRSYYNTADYYAQEAQPLWGDLAFDAT